jgi:putative colanic acid biosynthesis glycosyltransferase
MPLFTLATVTLNNAKGLEKTWNSIKSQDLGDYEWLVQDGASTDNTSNILKNTPALIQSAHDNGIYDAMNRLIERATGDYILFLNAGDTLAAPDTLSMITNHTNGKPDFIYGDAFEDTQNGIKQNKAARSHNKIALGMFTHHQSMLYKHAAIGELRYDLTYKIAADYDFTARFLNNCDSIEYIPAPICIFEPGGISQQQTQQGRLEQFQIRKNLNLCSPMQNHIITTLQSLNMIFRNIAPNLYWSLKRH